MNSHDRNCASLRCLAERELGAFMTAVTELYGPEEARISALNWIDEFEATDGSLEFTSRQLRLITIAAAARLAGAAQGAAELPKFADAAVILPKMRR